MPAVHIFSRGDNEILQELLRVFNLSQGTAKDQWSMQAELLIEPVGWNALWKLSKEFCKKFDERYPCCVYISVTSVNFEELTANVEVLSVQHKAVTIPESVMDVPLIELWPTVKQSEECVYAEATAEFIDLLRFFYDNLWMPWDDQEKVFLPNKIEDRMRLWTELHNGTIPNCVSREIILLRDSAINVHEKLRDLDSSLCDGDMVDEDDSMLPPNYLLRGAELNAKLDNLMSKWTLYENPLIREQYLVKAKYRWQKNKSRNNVVALWRGGNVKEFAEISNFLQRHVTDEHTLTIMVSAEDGLALEPDELVICDDEYDVPEMPLSQISIRSFKEVQFSRGGTLRAAEMRSCLLMMSEECRVTNLTLHCMLVNTVVAMRAGSLNITNCTLIDDSDNSQSDFTQGIVAFSGAKILIENCNFDNFYSGIVVHKGAQVEIRNCVIKRCGVAIQMYSGSEVKLNSCVISDCTERSIRCEADTECDKYSKMEGLHVADNCKIGLGDLNNEIEIVYQDVNLM